MVLFHHSLYERGLATSPIIKTSSNDCVLINVSHVVRKGYYGTEFQIQCHLRGSTLLNYCKRLIFHILSLCGLFAILTFS